MLVDMTLAEIVKAGKVTNPYQLFVLGYVLEFFKKGLKSASLHLENPITFDSQATSSALKQTLQNLSADEQVKLAAYLIDCLKAGECMFHDATMSSQEWINFVLQKQA